MSSEVIVEEGIVVSVENQFANVVVVQSESCNECSAKILCKPKSPNENIVKVINSLGALPGDKVRFEVKGSALLSASFMLYGIPILIFVIGIFLGLSVFSDYTIKELYAVLFGIGLIIIYFFLSIGKFKNQNKEVLPRIISTEVKKKNP